MKVIGITGTNGSGKGTVVELLQKKFPNIEHVSARDIILDYAKKCGVEINDRPSMDSFSEENNKKGWSVFKYFIDQHSDSEKIYILESIRRVSEIQMIRQYNLQSLFIAVDADVAVRYERVSKRGTVLDKDDFERFIETEKKQNESLEDNQMNLSRCINMSDFKIDNSSSLENLERQIDVFIEKNADFFVV